jgi:signal transduction histidine kinase
LGELVQVLLNKKLAQVLSAIGSAVLLVNSEGEFSFANKAAEKLLDARVIDLVGRKADSLSGPWVDAIRSRTRKRVQEPLALLGEGPCQKWISWEVAPLWSDDQIAGWVLVVDDRTDHYRWQEAVRQAERMSITASMVGALAHELRNPLASAKGLLQLMGRKREPERMRGYCDLVLRELDRVTALLNEFLLLGKPAEMVSEPVDLAEHLQGLLPLLEGMAANHSVNIVVKLPRVRPILADTGQLTQVLLNLVRNAIEAVPEEGLVSISLEEAGREVCLTVRDNGPGFSGDALRNLFRPFFTTKERGTGLGLPVVQAIVLNHGGRLSVHNATEGGAEFQVYLPLCGTSEPSHLDIALLINGHSQRYQLEQALRANGFSVLVCEKPDDIAKVAQHWYPAVTIVDNADKNHWIAGFWPQTKLISLGDFGGDQYGFTWGESRDLLRLINLVHSTLGHQVS